MTFKSFQKSVVYDYIEEKLGSLPGTERSFRNYINLLIETEQLKFNGNKRIYCPVAELPYARQAATDRFRRVPYPEGLKAVYIRGGSDSKSLQILCITGTAFYYPGRVDFGYFFSE